MTRGTIFAATKLPLHLWLMGIYLTTQSKDGISSQAALRMKHKLQQVMKNQDDRHVLGGLLHGRPQPGRQERPGSLVVSDGLSGFPGVADAECQHGPINMSLDAEYGLTAVRLYEQEGGEAQLRFMETWEGGGPGASWLFLESAELTGRTPPQQLAAWAMEAGSGDAADVLVAAERAFVARRIKGTQASYLFVAETKKRGYFRQLADLPRHIVVKVLCILFFSGAFYLPSPAMSLRPSGNSGMQPGALPPVIFLRACFRCLANDVTNVPTWPWISSPSPAVAAPNKEKRLGLVDRQCGFG